MKTISRYIMTLALLLTAVTGAWADETPLLTIESKDYMSFKSGSKTFDDKVTVTFSSSVDNYGDEWGWFASYPASLLTVAGTNGYTITSCKFYTYEGTAANGYTVVGESPSVYLSEGQVYTDANQSVSIGSFGITKIEVFGAAAPSGPEVAWNADTKTGNFTMPAYDVELTPIYAPEFTATFKAGNANTIQSGEGSKATVTVTEGTDVYTGATLNENGKLTPLYEGQTVTLTAAAGYKFRKVEVKKGAAELPKHADVVTICEKNGDNKYLISSFFDGTNANITTITKEEAIALAEYLGGGNILVVYEEYEFYGARYVRATNAAGKDTGLSLSTTNFSNAPLYYVPAGN